MTTRREKTPKAPKTTVIAVRVPIEQREAVESAAIMAGASVSAYIAATLTAALSNKKEPVPAPPEVAPSLAPPPRLASGIVLSDPAALAELKRIGININQLAHAANAGLPLNASEVIRGFAHLFELLADPEAFKRRLDLIKAGLAAQKPAQPQLRAPAEPPATPPIRNRHAEQPVPPAVLPPAPSPIRQPPAATSARAPRPPHVIDGIAKAAAARPAPSLPTRTAAPSRQTPPARLPPRPRPQPIVKDDRRDPPHPQARHQLQSRSDLHPARPAEGDGGKGRLGFFRKLWDR